MKSTPGIRGEGGGGKGGKEGGETGGRRCTDNSEVDGRRDGCSGEVLFLEMKEDDEEEDGSSSY